ncbi:hypothetical protein AAHA92_30179 [Salvia divinorum]|uniref:Uncharacterized protein n=1 Tax=Salvia divinorum TaxID=28513 RepID=A0ABD1G189_SALDI
MQRFPTIWAVIVIALIISPQAMQARKLSSTEKVPESSSSFVATPVSSSRALAEELFGSYRARLQLAGVDRRSLVTENPSPGTGHH